MIVSIYTVLYVVCVCVFMRPHRSHIQVITQVAPIWVMHGSQYACRMLTTTHRLHSGEVNDETVQLRQGDHVLMPEKEPARC